MPEIEQQRKIRHRLAVLRHAEEVTEPTLLTAADLCAAPATRLSAVVEKARPLS
jgi:hypothetical protein